MQVTLTVESLGYLLTAEDGQDVLVQTDWDYPGTASNLGWSPERVERWVGPEDDGAGMGMMERERALQEGRIGHYCAHSGTDGTVDCKDCGATAGEFIASAAEFLDSCDGDSFEDPGYFNEEG